MPAAVTTGVVAATAAEPHATALDLTPGSREDAGTDVVPSATSKPPASCRESTGGGAGNLTNRYHLRTTNPTDRRSPTADARGRGDGYGHCMGVETAAIAAAVLFGVVALFQLALALGIPWGAFAFGGRAVRDNGTLPPAYRAASAVTAVVLVLFAVVILTRAGVIGASGDSTLVTVMSWVIVAFMAINTPMNLLGRHWLEKYVFGGITLVLVVLCAVVAASGPS